MVPRGIAGSLPRIPIYKRTHEGHSGGPSNLGIVGFVSFVVWIDRPELEIVLCFSGAQAQRKIDYFRYFCLHTASDVRWYSCYDSHIGASVLLPF